MVFFRILIMAILISLVFNIGGCSKFNSTENFKIEEHVYTIPQSYWPKITVFGMVSAIIVYLALLSGLIMYIVGHVGGGNLNKGKIFGAIGMAFFVGLLGRSFKIYLQVLFTGLLDKLINNPILSGTIIDILLYIFWIAFIAGISVYVYEAFVVTAKEAHPM